MKYHLVNTPLGFFKKDQFILSSGMWNCRNEDFLKLKEAQKLKVAEYHWDNRDKFSKDFFYLSDLSEEILSVSAKQLNKIHNVDFPIRFWRILLKPWLNTFVPSVFDRWETVKKCFADYDIKSASVCYFEKSDVVPNSTSDFNSFYNMEDFWNEYIFSEILKYQNHHLEINLFEKKEIRKFTNIDTTNAAAMNKPLIQSYKQKFVLQIKSSLKKLIYVFFKLFNSVKKEDTIFFHDCLDKKDQFIVEAKLKKIPSLFKSKKIPFFEFDVDKRTRLLFPESGNSTFENFIYSLIRTQIPKIYIEGFNFLLDDGFKKWPSNPSKIICSGSIYADDYFKFYTARQVTENLSKLFIIQHGGHYGIGRLSCMLDHELMISDKFISWGWGEDDNKIINLPSLKISNMIKSSKYSKDGSLLIIAQDFTRYSYHLFSYPVSSQYISYEQDIKCFIKNLNQEIFNKSNLRFKHGGSYGWNEIGEFKKIFPNLILDDGREKLATKVADSRLCIQTANFTTYLESLALNIPTIIFWDPSMNELSDRAIEYFKDLSNSKIFFSNPYDAANHVNEIWNDVEGWWNSSAVQNSRSNFISKYALCSNSYIEDFVKYIKDN